MLSDNSLMCMIYIYILCYLMFSDNSLMCMIYIYTMLSDNSLNPVEGEQNICHLKNLILTLLGLTFRHIRFLSRQIFCLP
jgi:hypothetical protein